MPDPTAPAEAPPQAPKGTDPLAAYLGAMDTQLSDLAKSREELKTAEEKQSGIYEHAAADEMNAVREQEDRLRAAKEDFGEVRGRLATLGGPPAPQEEPPVPSRAIRPFGTVGPNDPPAQAMNTVLYSLGLLAQMGMGIAKGYPNGALAAYSGALRGWAEGDSVRAENMWKEYLANVAKMNREMNRQRQQYQDILQRYGMDFDLAKTHLGIAMAENGVSDKFIALTNRSADQAMKMFEVFDRSRQTINQQTDALLVARAKGILEDQRQRIAEAHLREQERQGRERLAQAERHFQAGREDKPVNAPAGGFVYDSKTKDRLETVTQGDLNREPTRYRRINHADAQLLAFVDTTPSMITQMQELIPRLLTQYPGQNIGNAIKLAAEGKAAMSDDLRQYLSLKRQLTVEATRILGGGGQLRITLMNALENEVSPRVNDTVKTASRALNTLSVDFQNRQRAILGEPQLQYWQVATPGTWVVKNRETGEMKGVKVGAGEAVGPEWQMVEPLIEGERR